MGSQSVNEITGAHPPRTWDRLTDPFASRRAQQYGWTQSVPALNFDVPRDSLVHQKCAPQGLQHLMLLQEGLSQKPQHLAVSAFLRIACNRFFTRLGRRAC